MNTKAANTKDISQAGMSGTSLVVVVAIALTLGACATRPDPGDQPAVAAYQEANDPIEPLNRYFFAVNDQLLDGLILKPAAQGYDAVLPRVAKDSIRHFLDNLRTPVILVNDVLQGEWDRAGTTITRFGINSTAGVGGLLDPATDWGYARHGEDFGQTLAVWGTGEGPYVYLPLLGPAPPRDLAGFVVDQAFDPLTYVFWNSDSIIPTARFAINGLDLRARNLGTLDEIERTSVDYYAALRSLYRQSRNNEIANGTIDPNRLPDISDIDYDYEFDAETPANDAIETQPSPASGQNTGI
ncbi:VacJ family lipoprotein [Pyruvatibacter sp.]|uniref:MlaA family lipoprotein n=1 Tax=Pyruvatibacter sp. TaxID=1981328 RepID=UPI0032EC72AB